MSTELEDIVTVGDVKQLDYCRDRYNYLLGRKMELDAMLEGTQYQLKRMTNKLGLYYKIKTEMLNLDELRTVIFLSVKNKANAQSASKF